MFEVYTIQAIPETVNPDDRFGYRITVLDMNGREFVAPADKMEFEDFKSHAKTVEEFVDFVEAMMREGVFEDDRGLVRIGQWRLRGDLVAGVRVDLIQFEKVDTP